TAGLIYIPGGMQVTAGIGGTANAGIQYANNGTVNPTDVLIATYVGAFTANTGLWGTMGWNAAGGATSSYLNGDDPFKGGVISGAASGLGYGIGKFAQGSLNNIFNPNWKSYEWVDMGMGISKPLTPSSIPGIAGNTGAAIATEGSGAIINEQINSLQEKK
ncbi:filamentous hemagglutinin, partial [Rahnella variigena]